VGVHRKVESKKVNVRRKEVQARVTVTLTTITLTLLTFPIPLPFYFSYFSVHTHSLLPSLRSPTCTDIHFLIFVEKFKIVLKSKIGSVGTYTSTATVEICIVNAVLLMHLKCM
jgi:hypothetical protein